nr:MAG TPA: hypothetical protein [Microviridae sp.]
MRHAPILGLPLCARARTRANARAHTRVYYINLL